MTRTVSSGAATWVATWAYARDVETPARVSRSCTSAKKVTATCEACWFKGAHYILGPFGIDCDLRRWGLKMSERGGKSAKKRAVVAVARKLAVLLHKLWMSGEAYDPFRNSRPRVARAA